MATFNLTFKRQRETKGAEVYMEVDADGNEIADDAAGKVVGTLYLRKSALNGTTPQTLKVKVEG